MKRCGFTLIELSIVLVIIGLVVGSVFVGRDLVLAAQVRSQMAQIEQFDAAANAFRNKYNCIAGDCANAASFGLGINGDGNGMIDNSTVSGSTVLEPWGFWHQLSSANLIAGTYNDADTTTLRVGIDSPSTKLVGHGEFMNGDQFYFKSAGGFMLGYSHDSSYYKTIFGALKPVWYLVATSDGSGSPGLYFGQEMKMLDNKIDDGMPMSGNVLAANSFLYQPPIYTSTDPLACMDDQKQAPQIIYRTDNVSGSMASYCFSMVRAGF